MKHMRLLAKANILHLRQLYKTCLSISKKLKEVKRMETAKKQRMLTGNKAMAEAIALEMEHNEEVFVLGEDVGKYGGIFGSTEGLLDKFGPERIMDTPISET